MNDELIDMSHAIVRAIAARDGEALDEILDDDFVHLATGDEPSPAQDKTMFMDAIRSASYDIVSIEVEKLRVKLADDVAVVVGVQDAEVRLANSQLAKSKGSFTDVFRRVDGRWKLWLAHSTELGTC